jgi:hypothetical protein
MTASQCGREFRAIPNGYRRSAGAVTRAMDGWNLGSGEAFAAPFADDSDFIAFDGERFRGCEELARFHDPLFKTHLRGTALPSESAFGLLAFVSALGCGLNAGVFFAFSSVRDARWRDRLRSSRGCCEQVTPPR